MKPVLRYKLPPDPLAHLSQNERIWIHRGESSFGRWVRILAQKVDVERLSDSDSDSESRKIPVRAPEMVGGRDEDEEGLGRVEAGPTSMSRGSARRSFRREEGGRGCSRVGGHPVGLCQVRRATGKSAPTSTERRGKTKRRTGKGEHRSLEEARYDSLDALVWEDRLSLGERHVVKSGGKDSEVQREPVLVDLDFSSRA